MDFKEAASCCALNRIFGFKPRVGLALIEEFGSASEIFSLNKDDIEHILGAYSPYKDLINRKAYSDAERELEILEKQGIRFINIQEDCYPALLHECEDAPIGLYIKSASPPEQIFQNHMTVSIVGTRDISSYGKEWCIKIVEALSRSVDTPSISITSGLALGTDITAHQTALKCKLPTIAVMATGIDSIYPQKHRHAAETIANTPNCALITDYPPGTAPLRINFLRRNRIIAGLSQNTILIESKSKGGGMLTARLAFSYSRDVHALPGRTEDIRSQGCNILIKEKIAEPIISEESLIENLGLSYRKAKNKPTADSIIRKTYASDSETRIGEMTKILISIRKNRGISIEELSATNGISYKETAEYVALLESDGLINTDILQRCYIRLK